MAEQITGTVSYLERIAMPPTAVVRVALVDASGGDGPPVVLAEVATEMGDRQVPIPFAIECPEDGIAYALRAEIAVDGQVQFATPEAIAPPSDGPPDGIAIRVHKTF